MAVYAAIGTAPPSFLDINGSQKDVPLNALYFTPNGMDASASPYASGTTGPTVYALLQQLVSQGLINPSASSVTASGAPSIIISTNIAGASGNGITVNFTNPSIQEGTVNVAVSASEVWAGLTADTLASVLGTSADTATGMIYLESQTPGAMPGGTPSAPLGAGPAFDLPILEADNTTTAFTLAATNTTADAALITVEVSLDPAPATTFTVTANWSKPATAVTLSSLEIANPFDYLVSFSGPIGALPAPGIVTLQGGADAVAANGATPAKAATAATASIFSAS